MNYELQPDGRYIVNRVLGDGFFQTGKKRARWRRLAPSKLTTFSAAEASDPTPPGTDGTHEATATLERVQEGLGGTLTRTPWTVSMRFFFVDSIPPHYISLNPIGLVVTYLRADEALRVPDR